MASDVQSFTASTGSAGSAVRDILRRAEKFYPTRTAVVCGEQRFTYREFGSRVRKLARVLQNLGVTKGERVAVLMLNCHRYLELYAACFEIGAIIVPLNIRLAPPEVVYTVNDAEALLLIVDDTFVPLAERLRPSLTSVRKYMYAGALEGQGPTIPLEMYGYERLLAEAEELQTPPPVNEEDVAGLFYTSGTTGDPKGVMLTNRNICINALQNLAAIPPPSDLRFLHSIPMFHLAGGPSAWLIFWFAGTHVVQQRFEPKQALELVEREKISAVTWVPTMITMLLAHPDVARTDFSSLQRVTYGASPIAPSQLRQAIETFGCEFTQAYGMTEAAPVLTLLTPEDHRLALEDDPRLQQRLLSCGREILGVVVHVVDGAGKDVAPGEVGEIIARGANLMLGYWRKPEDTAAVLRDGWYYSGDMGTVDEDGYIYIVDRKKDMIISGGENIYSIEVENALSSHPAVLECAVVGVPDEQWGEAVKAIVVPYPGRSATAEELIAHCRELIAGYKCPRSIDFMELLPKSGSGKILKRELRDRYWQNRGRKVN